MKTKVRDPDTLLGSWVLGRVAFLGNCESASAHEPLTPPCSCGLPLLRSDRVCPRCGRTGPRGQRVPNGVEIRARLAEQYGVHADYIKQIWRGDAWAA